jgi:tyrosyl-tRNA synthetase
VFLIGDATALVGDPSGQSKMRKLMTEAEVEANAETYHLQVKKILDVGKAATFERRRNSEWFGGKTPFGLKELVELTSRHTVARLIERDDFQKRMKAGQEVSMLELFYPLMQGYDSVMLKSDVELGGTDQKFNLLVGRDLQRAYGQEPQAVVTMPLLEGTDGTQKMSKSLGNHIGINDPPGEMFGKLMSIPDALIVKYATLLTGLPGEALARIEQDLAQKRRNPRDIKADVASAIIELYHPGASGKAREEFAKVFTRRETPTDMPVVPVAGGPVNLVDLLLEQGIVKTKNEARRLLTQGAIKLDGVAQKQPAVTVPAAGGVLQVGSRHFRRLVPNT